MHTLGNDKNNVLLTTCCESHDKPYQVSMHVSDRLTSPDAIFPVKVYIVFNKYFLHLNLLYMQWFWSKKRMHFGHKTHWINE